MLLKVIRGAKTNHTWGKKEPYVPACKYMHTLFSHLTHRMAFFCPTLRISHRLIVKSLQLTKLKQTSKLMLNFLDEKIFTKYEKV